MVINYKVFIYILRSTFLASAATISISSRGNRPTSFYPAPSSYQSVPQPFIITSRPLIFTDNSSQSLTHTIKPKASTKVSLFSYVPGVATVFCKGTNCGQNTEPIGSSVSSHYGHDDDGFAGEAIPIDPDDDFLTVSVSGVKGKPPIIVTNGYVQPILFPKPPALPGSSIDKVKPSSSVVNLMTDRPYLQRKPAKTTAKTTNRSTTKRSTTGTTFRRRTRRTTPPTTSKPNVAADAVNVQTLSRPRPSSLFIPAVTAFTLMALPVAAAAVPLIIQAGKRRRRRSNSFENQKFLMEDLAEILKDLTELNFDENIPRNVISKYVAKAVNKVQTTNGIRSN